MEETTTQTREEQELAEMRMVADKRGYLVLNCEPEFFFAGKIFQGRSMGKFLPIVLRATEKTDYSDWLHQELLIAEPFVIPSAQNCEYWRCEAMD